MLLRENDTALGLGFKNPIDVGFRDTFIWVFADFECLVHSLSWRQRWETSP